MSEFCPRAWPEESPPSSIHDCDACGLIEHGSRMILGEGNPSAPIMVILDNPGMREDRDGNPFVCGTRQTLQKVINSVGLSENDLYVTYILKRRPTRKYDKQKTRQICMNHHLYDQLKVTQPSHIICLGNVAVQSFFQDEEAEVRTLRGKTYNIRGFKTTVAYHPLTVRRRPNLWNLFIEDWQFLADQFFKEIK
ncbi:uracil-DNA glycosylase [Halalkalibacterium halodurans]|uniref:uracil-DNA glycosylase n=1 Tax=Halalkalibacterium halodurans TaxID=86665 RepID=UPI002E22DC89|nr:uracil-DNA glycosylase [Halalkalibacterium halodurans]